MSRTVYWVSPMLGSWDVKRGAAVLSHHERKREAVRAAAKLARADRPSVLRIQRRDGSIESRRLYGNDPLPAPG
ncbi:DUF2188 domain-containing protein [Amycolatopsis thermalba]|uniref:DUF2188 domain-containing protein n=1 Tax=Amycolatopsis thermalba TaxID=944492 RepID=A0ABY4NQM2_9PSEU|nr:MULTISPECIES: DUF2188 domain-containing protein [Amycolatopsis]UQS22039.1 DUF2188 domain-containing protein [Amycolatopsis thermalba]